MSLFHLLLLCAGVFLLMLGAGFAHARRGIGPWSLLPWDYILLLSAAVLVGLLAWAAMLWRDGA